MAEGIQIETVKTNMFSMDYFKFGSVKRTFVILPGLSVQSVMSAAETIAEAYRVLTADFTVYVFDRRKELPDRYTVYDMARDTAEAFQALELKEINLFGASQGGMIAMEIAAGHPELIKTLVLGSASVRVAEEQFQPIENWIRLAKDKNAEALYLAFGEALYPPRVFEQSRDLLTEAAKTVTDGELSRFIIFANGLEGFNGTDALGQIRCPVLVIGDRDDRVLGAEASKEIGDSLKNCPEIEVYLYEGYGHAVYDTAPDYKDRILHFLQKTKQD